MGSALVQNCLGIRYLDEETCFPCNCKHLAQGVHCKPILTSRKCTHCKSKSKKCFVWVSADWIRLRRNNHVAKKLHFCSLASRFLLKGSFCYSCDVYQRWQPLNAATAIGIDVQHPTKRSTEGSNLLMLYAAPLALFNLIGLKLSN